LGLRRNFIFSDRQSVFGFSPFSPRNEEKLGRPFFFSPPGGRVLLLPFFSEEKIDLSFATPPRKRLSPVDELFFQCLRRVFFHSYKRVLPPPIEGRSLCLQICEGRFLFSLANFVFFPLHFPPSVPFFPLIFRCMYLLF